MAKPTVSVLPFLLLAGDALSGFTVVYERSNTPVDTGVFQRIMDRLKHRGPDGSDVFLGNRIILGHWHFWTTPEEIGEKQPLKLEGLPFHIVLDGRLDNRSDLISKLNLNPAEASHLSDAVLILHSYARWGETCFEHFIGEYALVIFDERRAELICARDALGDRTLFYSVHGSRVVIASEPWAVAGADGMAAEINENAVAHYFALKAVEDGQTFFKAVSELLPAHGMIINPERMRQWRYWQPDPSQRVRGKRDEDLADEFRALLEQSVRSRLRSSTPVGVLMSGGLDSGSVACLASQMIAPEPLTTISYIFDELKDCDEREYINTIIARYGIRSVQIPCDDAWPFKDWENWPHPANQPEMNPYRLLKERAYQRAHEEGLRVLMPGAFGDELYSGEEDWLADMFIDGRLREAGRELKRHIRYTGWRKTLNSRYLRRTGRRLLNAIPVGKRLRRKAASSAWLSSHSAAHLNLSSDWLDPAFELRGGLLGVGASQDSAYENFNASRHALELRHPYRDRRLIEFILTLPAYHLYNRGFYKYILRVAMKDALPYQILSRTQSTPLLSLFSRGLDREDDLLQAYYQNPSAIWRKYVRPDWLLERSKVKLTRETDGPEAVISWLCVSYSTWYQTSFLSEQHGAIV
jgi:asparagine synthase (glutamine-hydrolysing)